MNKIVSIETRRVAEIDAARLQTVDRPRYITLASGRKIATRVVDMLLVCSRDLWASGMGAQLIERLRLRFVGLTRDEITEIVFGHCLAIDAENAAFRSHLAGAMEVAHQARNGVWWQDAAA